MARLKAANNAETVLAQSVGVDDLTIIVEDASELPDTPFKLTIENEIVEVTEVNGNELTVLRSQENTVASSYDAGMKVENLLTAGSYNELATEKQVNEHQADYTQHVDDETAHGIGDKTTLQTTEKTSIVGAINEVFTNVSDGKDLIGGAITDKDSNIEVPTDPTFQYLADAIGSIEAGGTGKKWASGSSMTTKVNSRDFVFTVTGLGFKPNLVIGLYNNSALYGFSTYITYGIINVNFGRADSTTTFTDPITVSQGEFTSIHRFGSTFNGDSYEIDWVAFE